MDNKGDKNSKINKNSKQQEKKIMSHAGGNKKHKEKALKRNINKQSYISLLNLIK